MEVEDHCDAVPDDLLGMGDFLPDDLWGSLDYLCPDKEGGSPGSPIEDIDLLLDLPSDDAGLGWEGLLDGQEIRRLWPESSAVDIDDPGMLLMGLEGAAEAFPVDGAVLQAKSVISAPQEPLYLPDFEKNPQASTSVSQISSEQQWCDVKQVEGGQPAWRRVQGKRTRNDEGERSSDGDADSPEDSKKHARLVRNRESASQSRERKKQRLVDMEQRCASLENQVKALSGAVTATALENAALREELARQQLYHHPPPPQTGRSRGKGARKNTGTEPAVLSSDSLPWSFLSPRSTCFPSPLAPSPQQQLLQPLASGPFLLFVLLLVCANPLGSVEGRSGSQLVSSKSRLLRCLRVVGLVQDRVFRRRLRGRRRSGVAKAGGRTKEIRIKMVRVCKNQHNRLAALAA